MLPWLGYPVLTTTATSCSSSGSSLGWTVTSAETCMVQVMPGQPAVAIAISRPSQCPVRHLVKLRGNLDCVVDRVPEPESRQEYHGTGGAVCETNFRQVIRVHQACPGA